MMLLTLATVASSAVFATKYPPLPSPEALSGVWLASNERGSHYRLVLDSGRKGTLALLGRFGRPLVYDVETFELNRYAILLHVNSRESGEKYEIKGEALHNSIRLRDKRFWGKEAVVFFPEAEWVNAGESLKAATG